MPPMMKMYPQYLRETGYYCTNNSKKDYQFKEPKGTWDESSGKAHWRNRPEGAPFFAYFTLLTTHESMIWPLDHDPQSLVPLREAMWEPLEGWIDPTRPLLVVPDLAVGHLPLEIMAGSFVALGEGVQRLRERLAALRGRLTTFAARRPSRESSALDTMRPLVVAGGIFLIEQATADPVAQGPHPLGHRARIQARDIATHAMTDDACRLIR